MHVYIGGAYNGKRDFVKQHYPNYTQQFFEGHLPENLTFKKQDIVVIGRFEQIVKQLSHLTEDEVVAILMKKLQQLDAQATLVCVCTDMGRGIVPLEKEQRFLRDTCGRLYQAMFAYSEQVTRIWYGIPQILKEVQK
ncbi:bifunctional adenosylcobinamide kinase/adenosylcobinamide-phosphate guanylyltransferase [Bacillus ndiopicus]|uniref:bifunctional adenosylcobinamide kinase/adenosylcobinamide-phosphate guanylyltransferase n=1 Tax=Bacillus ndiopicus TaxID=1347368 RepID=UPI0005A8CB8F|nr:bifunctional adenosylcobinamide kinase/adenosylcobinamide-phosphate guanylyltransferase [Bacillus ndiopicus]